MNAGHLITDDIPQLKTSTTGREALDIMGDNYVQHLPIVNNKELLGIISEEDILEHDENESIGSYYLSMLRAQVSETDHVFDVMRQMALGRLSLIPVIDGEDNYLGVIVQQDLLLYFATSFSLSEPGGIIILETSKPDYAMSEIARVVESENSVIISSFITSNPNDNRILVHLKLNNSEVQRVTAAFERYGYIVIAIYSDDKDSDILKDRYESLMHYLNV